MLLICCLLLGVFYTFSKKELRCCWCINAEACVFGVYVQVVEDGYEFFAKRQLVTLFSAPNYCGEFDNAGAMMSVDETLMCSFQVSFIPFLHLLLIYAYTTNSLLAHWLVFLLFVFFPPNRY